MIAEEQGRHDAVRLIDQAIITGEVVAEIAKGADHPVRVMKPLKFRQS